MISYTTRRGRTHGHSKKQHGKLHVEKADHTHINPDGSRTRETFERGKLVKRHYRPRRSR